MPVANAKTAKKRAKKEAARRAEMEARNAADPLRDRTQEAATYDVLPPTGTDSPGEE